MRLDLGFRELPAGVHLAGVLLLYFSTQDVSGIPALRGTAEGLFLLLVLWEMSQGMPAWRRVVFNPVYLSAMFFLVSALLSCVLSPFPKASFGELQSVLKHLLLLPAMTTVIAYGLIRRGWTANQVAGLLLIAVSLSGAGQLLWLALSYAQEYLSAGSLPVDPYFHRYKVGAALLAFPFVLMAISIGGHWLWRIVLASVAWGLILMVLSSNSRGAWLGLFVCVIYLGASQFHQLVKQPKWLGISMLGTCLVGVIGVPLLSQSPWWKTFLTKLNQGFDTSLRAGNGVWGAAMDMIREGPWHGYGYGDGIYIQAYNSMLPSYPLWIVRDPIGAHNSVLTHWIAAGVPGLLAVALMYIGFMIGVRRQLSRLSNYAVVKSLVHASIAAMLALYWVRAQVETVRWDAFGILLGLCVWLYVVEDSSLPAAMEAGETDKRCCPNKG